ncbi:MAG: formylmethanofuran dehydrogenase subunit C [Pirellulaceae bacterium]|nr:formylmethanofuran dehydrogenase subunit C [Pirellulaceae bacterium]
MELELTEQLTLPLDLSEVLLRWSPSTNADDAARQQVNYGNRKTELGEIFRIRGDYQHQRSIWIGDLGRATGLGTGLKSGLLTVEGNVGHRTGLRLMGGTIVIGENSGDDLGCEMSAGSIWVAGSSGDRAGGCGSGVNAGMRGGILVIEGSVGTGVGLRMRRGTIIVGGDAGNFAGFQLIAGTIVIGGTASAGLAHEMKRGTVIANRVEDGSIALPRFRLNGVVKGGILSVLSRLLPAEIEANFPSINSSRHPKLRQLLEQTWRAYSGDHLQTGLGELLVSGDAEGAI